MERLMNTWFRLGSLAVVLNFMILAVFFSSPPHSQRSEKRSNSTELDLADIGETGAGH